MIERQQESTTNRQRQQSDRVARVRPSCAATNRPRGEDGDASYIETIGVGSGRRGNHGAALPLRSSTDPCHTTARARARHIAIALTIASSLCVTVACHAGDAQAAPSLGTFDQPDSPANWTFNNGPEYPGAKGELSTRYDGGERGDVMVLSYDFSDGGNYVAMIRKLPPEPKIRAVRMLLNKQSDILLIVRAVDQKGETFQKDFRYHYPGWQQVEIALDGWVFNWGGDGTFQKPAKQFDLLVENDGGTRVGELLIDEVRFVTPAWPIEEHLATTTYIESQFDDKGWSIIGPAENKLDDGVWRYAFTDGVERIGLGRGTSVLGQPARMIVTVESDGSGHEVTASYGSHFQYFHRTLGTLTEKGEQTFDVSLGDMTEWRHEGGENDGVVRYPLRLENIGLVKKGQSDTGAIKMKRLSFETQYDPSLVAAVIPRVTQLDDNRVRFDVEMRGPGSSPLDGMLEYEIRTIDRSVKKGMIPNTLPASGVPITKSLNAEFGDATMLEGVFAFRAGSKRTPRYTCTIAKADTASADTTLNPKSRVGAGLYLYRFHTHPDRVKWMDRMGQLAAAAGVKWTREEFHWNWIEKKKGEFDWTFFDELVDSANRHGISIYGLVCYWTEWTGEPLTEEFIPHYCDFLRALVTRYKDRIKHWEIWNEPNIFFWPGPKQLYPKLLEAAYKTIKEVDPDAKVLGCSTAGIDTKFIQLVLDAGVPFDDLTVHPYRHELDATGFIEELNRASKQASDRPVWITEMGWPSNIGGLTEREQAGFVARTYLSGLASPNVRSVSWYDFREDGTDPFYNEHHFGLVRQNLTPKIGYRALAALGNLLGDASFERVLSPGDNVVGLAYRGGDKHIAAYWTTDRTRLVGWTIESNDDADADGEATPSKIRWLNMMGEPAMHYDYRGMTVLRMEKNLPIYVVSNAPLSLVSGNWPVSIAARRTAYHPGDAVEFDVTLDAQTSIKIGEVPISWRMEKNESGVSRVMIPTDAAPRDYEIEFEVRTMGKPMQTLPVKVRVAPLLVRG